MKLLFFGTTRPVKPMYKSPADIDKAEKGQTDQTKPMKDMGERLRGDNSMTKNHTPRRFMTKKMIDYMTEVIRDTVLAHGEAVPAWLLVKVMTRLGEVGAGFAEEGPEEVKVKRFEASPQLIYKDEDGCKYKTKVEISHGKPNRYMKAAQDQYGKDSRWLQVPYLNASEANLQKAVFAQAGCNRQGIATWGCWTDNSTINDDGFTSNMIYNYYGLASEGMMANEFARTGIRSGLRDSINNDNYFKQYYNIDLLTNINSRFSTHTFFNSQEFSDVNIKIYVCEAINVNSSAIWSDVAPFGGTASSDYKVPRYSPAAKTSSSYTVPIKATGAGYNWFPTEPAVDIKHMENDGTTATTSPIKVETASVLGLTPQQSQVFKKNWKVLDVLDNTLGPNDTWDVHLEQRYNKSHSVRSWCESFSGLPLGSNGNYANQFKKTVKGDIVLLTVFSGMPSSNYILNDTSPGTAESNTFPVDAGPSRVRHTVRHGISISWPESIQPLDMTSIDPLEAGFSPGRDQGWRVLKQKTNYTDRETYKYDSGEIKVSTRSTIQDDKSKSNAGT